MHKKIAYLLIAFLLAVTFSTNSVYAKEISSAQTTDLNENSKITFGWDETPYIFSIFGQGNATAVETWTAPDSTLYTTSVLDNGTGDLDSGNKRILNLLDNWNTRKTVGIWSWTAKSSDGSTVISNTFTVTPEPISYALFLIGGVALAVKQYRKKKDV